MLSTGLTTPLTIGVALFATLCVALCVVVYRWMLKLAAYCRDAVAFVQNQNKNAVSLRRLAEVEATLTELLDSYDALLMSHKKLRARISMRSAREKHVDNVNLGAPPADEAGKAAYKEQLRQRLRKEGRL